MRRHIQEQARTSGETRAGQVSEHTRAWVAYTVEGIGTFGLVFAGCGAIMIDTLFHGQVTHVGVGLETMLTFFLMMVVMAMATDTRAVGQAAALAIGAPCMRRLLIIGGSDAGISAALRARERDETVEVIVIVEDALPSRPPTVCPPSFHSTPLSGVTTRNFYQYIKDAFLYVPL